MTAETRPSLLPPVVKSIVVARSQADVFRLWWPSANYSRGKSNVATVVMEARVGGRLFERWHDGTEKHSSEVELRFVALGRAGRA